MTTWSKIPMGEQQLGEGNVITKHKNGKTWGCFEWWVPGQFRRLGNCRGGVVVGGWDFFFTVDGDRLRGVCEDCIHIMDVEYGVQLFGKVAFFWSEKLQMTLRIVKFSVHSWGIHDDLNGYDEWIRFATRCFSPKKAEEGGRHFFVCVVLTPKWLILCFKPHSQAHGT